MEKKKPMDRRWSTSSGSVYNLGFHLIWCPKYRRKVLVGDVAEKLKQYIRERCDENGWQLEVMEVMPDHVHLFLKCKPTDSVAYIMAQLKGYTSRQLNKSHPELKSRLPNLWTRSYYAESVGVINESAVRAYIENQKWKKPNSSHA
jgi:putative transposase